MFHFFRRPSFVFLKKTDGHVQFSGLFILNHDVLLVDLFCIYTSLGLQLSPPMLRLIAAIAPEERVAINGFNGMWQRGQGMAETSIET